MLSKPLQAVIDCPQCWAIRSKGRTDRFYVFIPLPLAAAIGLAAGEEVQWSVADRNALSVHRIGPRVAPRRGVKAAQAKKRS